MRTGASGKQSAGHRVSFGGPLTIGLLLILLVGTVTVGSALMRAAAADAARAVSVNEVLQRAALAVSSEESLERKYLLEPGPEARDAHAAAEDALDAAMAELLTSPDPADRALAEHVRQENGRYVSASAMLFKARDDNATDEQIEAVDSEQIDPVFTALEEEVTDAAAVHHARALEAGSKAQRTGTVVVVTDLVTLLVVLLAFGLVGLRVRSTQRELQRRSRENAHQATHDALTGLPNRVMLHQRVTAALATQPRSDSAGPVEPGNDAAEAAEDGIAVLLLDLNRFKEVNDTLGHQAGDELLVQVGQRLAANSRGVDLVARLGGDEFALLLTHVSPAGAIAAAERLTEALHQTFHVLDVALDVEASIGIACATTENADVALLLQHADVAMYQAKEHHQPYAVYEPGRDLNTPGRLTLLGDLRRALGRSDELYLVYQPKVATDTGRVLGAEALVRWQHPDRGLIPPVEFIPTVETTGLIDDLTFYVLRKALEQQQEWRAQGLTLPVAVNISPRSLLDPRFPDRVTEMLDRYEIPGNQLVLELTESAIMTNPDAAVAALQLLVTHGIKVAIDDFGTGYSSMAYLKQLPVSELKIDRSFVTDMHGNDNNAVLVQSTVDLGHNLGMTVVAEGVEDQDVMRQLNDMGCDVAQGYHISRPVSPADLENWLSARGLFADAEDTLLRNA